MSKETGSLSSPGSEPSAKPKELSLTAKDSPKSVGDQLGRVLLTLASQAALISALLFLIGWFRVQATFGYFGINSSMLGLSTSDYLLRSVDAAFRPLIAIGILALAGIYIHEKLLTRVKVSPAFEMRLCRSLKLTGIVVGFAGLTTASSNDSESALALIGSTAFLLGITCFVYALLLRQAVDPAIQEKAHRKTIFVIAMLGMAAFLWTVISYASAIGIGQAKQIKNDLDQAPSVIIYSKEDLALSRVDTSESRIFGGAYRFRYTGLRLLVRSDDRLFLLSMHWRRSTGSVIMLPDKPDPASMRIEIMAGDPGAH